MSIMHKALEEIRFQIPYPILEQSFIIPTVGNSPSNILSLDSMILDKVITPKVIADTNIVGGQLAMIPVNQLNYSYFDNWSRVYDIPSELIDGRNVMTVLSAHYLPQGYTFSMGTGGNAAYGPHGPMSDIGSAATRLGNSFSSVPVISTASVQLVGNNTVLVRDRNYITHIYALKVILDNQQDLSNINPRFWLVFSDLCVLAVKAYIYNILILNIGQGYLSGGQELGPFKDIVDDYRESYELYRDMLETKWRKANFWNDREQSSQFLRSMIRTGI